MLRPLSSHSFRRGGAQHANGDAAVSAQWIFDRGAWNLSTTNKAFAYVFNTTNEDQKIAKVLSGWSTTDQVEIQDLSCFDAVTAEKIASVQAKFFDSCQALAETQYNVCAQALGVLTAQLIKNYPMLKQLYNHSPAVDRIEECLLEAGCDVNDLLAWAVQLERRCHMTNEATSSATATAKDAVSKLLERQMVMIDQLSEQNVILAARLRKLEGPRVETEQATRTQDTSEATVVRSVKRKRKAPPAKPSEVWYEWYTHEPRVRNCDDPKRKSHFKIVVGFLKIFLAEGIKLDEAARDYKDKVLAYGRHAEKQLFQYLDDQGITSRAAGTVIKHMRTFHREGKLDECIRRHCMLAASEKIVDPAPAYTHFLHVISA